MSEKKSFVISLSTFLSQTNGRDKACRIIQYFSRFLAAHYRLKAEPVADKTEYLQKAGKVDKLGTAMGMTRKVLRFGRPIAIIMDVLKTINSILEGSQRNVPKGVCKALGSISLALFFLFDHYLWFTKIGIFTNAQLAAKFDFLSNLFWLFECIFGILRNIFQYLQISGGSSSDKKRKIQDIYVDTARNILDMPIAYGFINSQFISNSKMGTLGTITSLIGSYQMWK